VVSALCWPVEESGAVARPATVGRTLALQLDTTREALKLETGRETTLALVGAFARIVGLLTLELNGQFVGGFEPADDLFAAFVEREADDLGL
jgi:hypothetical protein